MTEPCENCGRDWDPGAQDAEDWGVYHGLRDAWLCPACLADGEVCRRTARVGRYYAVPLVAVVYAANAEAARDAVIPREENELDELDAYRGIVYAGEAHPITEAMAQEPYYSTSVFYGEMELMDGDDE